MFQPTIDPKSEFRTRWSIGDVLLPLAIISLIFIIVQTASKFTGTYDSEYVINLSLSLLPNYAMLGNTSRIDLNGFRDDFRD